MMHQSRSWGHLHAMVRRCLAPKFKLLPVVMPSRRSETKSKFCQTGERAGRQRQALHLLPPNFMELKGGPSYVARAKLEYPVP